MAASYPLINGVRYDWSAVEINLNGLVILGIKEVSYKNALDPGQVYGTHAQKLGRTRGQYNPEGSITLYKQEYNDLVTALGAGFMEAVFDITVSYSAPGQPVITDRVRGCRIKAVDQSHSQSTDALVVKCDLDVMMILENGVAPITNMLGAS